MKRRYKYKARDIGGNLIKGVISGNDKEQALGQLKKNNLYPFKLKLISRRRKGRLLSFRKIKDLQMSNFCKELSTLLRAGISIPQALRMLSQKKNSYFFKEIIYDLINSLEQGESLYQVLIRYKERLPNYFCSQIKAGEETNSLETVLEQLADYYLNEDQFQKKINQLLAYPMVLLVTSIIVICFMLVKVIPGFQVIYKDFQTDLPLLTHCLLAISSYYQVILVSLLLCISFLSFFFKIPFLKKKLILLQFKVPIWGKFKKKLETARLARTLSLFLKNGLEILTAVKITSGTLGFPMNQYLERIQVNIQQGKSFAYALRLSDFFPEIFIEMVTVGEKSGTLLEMMSKVAEIYENESKNHLEKIISLLEPALLLIIASIVGIIIFAIMLPLFDMIKLI